MSLWIYILLAIASIAILIYVFFFYFLDQKVKKEEQILLNIFIRKTGKIPGIIEVMRPYVASEKAFDSITWLHSKILVGNYDSIYDMLEDNGRLQNDFLFLMELSQRIRFLQKDEYFIYMRDFIVEYERDMRKRFLNINVAIKKWNRFVQIKNITLVWFLLPWVSRAEIL